jgi:hypothetical protein
MLNGALIVGGLTAIIDFFMQRSEHQAAGKKLAWDSYDGFRAIRRTLLGGLGGAAVGYGVYVYNLKEEEKISFDSDDYLKKILSVEDLKNDPDLFRKAHQHREKVKDFLSNEFSDQLVCSPADTGSFKKRTAIASKFDLDLILPFRKGAYGTLEEMYSDVFNRLGRKFEEVALVYRKTMVVGLRFGAGERPIHFDIVPGREINDYLTDKNLNLFVRPGSIWQRGSSFKTNTDVQRNLTVNQPEARKVIKLLKIYRDRNSLALPTLTLEQCVIEALSDNKFGTYTSETENLLNSMNHLASKLNQNRLIDLANTNNNLHDKLSDTERFGTADQLLSDISKIEENPRYIKEIFEC